MFVDFPAYGIKKLGAQRHGLGLVIGRVGVGRLEGAAAIAGQIRRDSPPPVAHSIPIEILDVVNRDSPQSHPPNRILHPLDLSLHFGP